MFGIGSGEILVIIIVALLVLGPEKLPSMARTLGKAMGELRRMSTEFHRELNSVVEPENFARNDGAAPRQKSSSPEQGAPEAPDSAASRVSVDGPSADTKEPREV